MSTFYKKVVNRLSQIDTESKQINFLDERFYERKGKYYPSITSVLQYYPKGKQFENWLKDVGWTADHIAQKSAEDGTLTHKLVERYLEGEKIEWLNQDGSAKYPLEVWKMTLKFAEFWETYKPTLIESEIHLFSDEYEIAGTCDLVVEIDKEIWILDVKTSNHLLNIYDLQTAAYTKCWNESFEEKVTRAGILWLKSSKRGPDKTNKKIQGKGWELYESSRTVEENWKLFTHVHALYKLENPDAKPTFDSFPLTIQLFN